MRTPSFLLTTALVLSSGCAADYQSEQTPVSATAKAEGSESTLSQAVKGGNSQPADKIDPCAALIQDPYLKNFYGQWKKRFDELVEKTKPVPQELHDANAQMCEMTAPNVGLIFARDGQFAGHEIKPNKPDLSSRVALEMGNESLDEDTNPNPSHNYFNFPPYCQRLVLDTWKQWDLVMPGENGPSSTPQFAIN